MKERPILFSGPMVRAILEGRKTVTRRVMKPQPEPCDADDPRGGHWWPSREHQTMLHVQEELQQWTGLAGHACPYGEPGDRLWVRESCAQVFEVDIPAGRPVGPVGTAGSPSHPDWKSRYVYKADGDMPNVQWHHVGDCQPVRWTPSIHMPRLASRILLEITAVRVERLHDGEGETAYESRYIAEGINRIHHGDGEYYYHAFQNEPGPGNWCDPFDAWRELWVSVNGAESWDANPWVWVVEFKRLEVANG